MYDFFFIMDTHQMCGCDFEYHLFEVVTVVPGLAQLLFALPAFILATVDWAEREITGIKAPEPGPTACSKLCVSERVCLCCTPPEGNLIPIQWK